MMPVKSDLQYWAALVVALTGILVPAFLALKLSHVEGWAPNDIAALIGLFTSIVGTLVGAFLGVQVGMAGKLKAELLAQRALAELPADKRAELLKPF